MALPVFPIAVLGAPQRTGYGIAHEAGSIRLRKDDPVRAGISIYRRMRYYPSDMVTVMWRFTDAQMYTFRLFFQDDLMEGALWFIMPLVMGDGNNQNMPTPPSVKNVKAHFTDMHQASISGVVAWTVTAMLEVAYEGRVNASP